jgi:hypothetical protein
MSFVKKEFEKRKFEVTTDGKAFTIEGITMLSPTVLCRSECNILKTEVNKAQVSLSKSVTVTKEDIEAYNKGELEEEKKEPTVEEKAKSVKHIINVGGADLDKCQKAFLDLLDKSNSKLQTRSEGDQRCTSDFMEEMDYKLLDELMVDYIANFII